LIAGVIAVAVVMIVVFGIRLYGITPHGTRTASVHIGGTTNAAADARMIAIAAANACGRPRGAVASVLDLRGPSTVVVIASPPTGPPRHFTVSCATGHVIKST
jgi:hypothetical protein